MPVSYPTSVGQTRKGSPMGSEDEGFTEYRSTMRVFSKDENGDDLALLYAEGDVIPLDEAERQGLVGKPAKAKADVETKPRAPRKTAARKPRA